MTWSIAWSFVAERSDIRRIYWRTGERIDAAIMRFAATGLGGERVGPASAHRWIVRVPGAEAHLLANPQERVVYVMRVFRRG